MLDYEGLDEMPKTGVAEQTARKYFAEALAKLEGEIEDDRELLFAAQAIRDSIEMWEIDLVRRLRRQEFPETWAAIGGVLGITKQGAILRYAKYIPEQ